MPFSPTARQATGRPELCASLAPLHRSVAEAVVGPHPEGAGHVNHDVADRELRVVAEDIDAVRDRAAGPVTFVHGLKVDEEGVERVATRLLEAVRSLQLPHPAPVGGPFLSVSIGGAFRDTKDRRNPDALLAAADEALYRAKDSGRDRAVISGN